LLKATGTVVPLTSVDVRPQSTSVITRIHVREGQFVRKGELLFTLDARTEEANVAKARAQVAKDEAALADAKRQFERAKELLKQNFISQGALDTNLAQVESQAAVLAADKAALDAAQIAATNARVTAPGPGRLGVISVSVGSSVLANQTNLVTVTQLEPIAVLFNIPQRNLGDALNALNGGGAPVTATLAGGEAFQGRLQFVDNAVDASSGTVKAKAVFANAGAKLWPGAFVEVAQTVSTLKAAVIVPQAAIIQGARGTAVYVMEEGKAALRPVQLVNAQGQDAAVTGLKAGELVVLDGKQNVRPGSPLTERAKEPKGAASGPARADSAPAVAKP
jgi:RND family efflux transporter MFP subunit